MTSNQIQSLQERLECVCKERDIIIAELETLMRNETPIRKVILDAYIRASKNEEK
jgi:hypothetical protein